MEQYVNYVAKLPSTRPAAPSTWNVTITNAAMTNTQISSMCKLLQNCWGTLRLNLSGIAMGDASASDLAVAMAEDTDTVQLVELLLQSNRIGDVGIGAIADLITQQKSLSLLSLASNSLSYSSTMSLSYGIALSSLTDLDLRECGIDCTSLLALARALQSSMITALDLSGNAVGDDGAVFLSRALCGELADVSSAAATLAASKPLSYRRLALAHCSIGAQGFRALGVSIFKGFRCMELVVDDNPLAKDDGCASLALALTANADRPDRGEGHQMAMLSLQNCRVGPKTLALLAAIVKSLQPSSSRSGKLPSKWVRCLDLRMNFGCGSPLAVVLATELHETFPQSELRLGIPPTKGSAAASKEHHSPQVALAALYSAISATMSWLKGGGGVDHGRFPKESARAIIMATWLDSCFVENTRATLNERAMREAFSDVTRCTHRLARQDTYRDAYTWPAYSPDAFKALEIDARARLTGSPKSPRAARITLEAAPINWASPTKTLMMKDSSRSALLSVDNNDLVAEKRVAISPDQPFGTPLPLTQSSGKRISPLVALAPSSNASSPSRAAGVGKAQLLASTPLVELSTQLKVQLADADIQLINDLVHALAANRKGLGSSDEERSTAVDTGRKTTSTSDAVKQGTAPPAFTRSHGVDHFTRDQKGRSGQEAVTSLRASSTELPVALLPTNCNTASPLQPVSKPQKLQRKQTSSFEPQVGIAPPVGEELDPYIPGLSGARGGAANKSEISKFETNSAAARSKVTTPMTQSPETEPPTVSSRLPEKQGRVLCKVELVQAELPSLAALVQSMDQQAPLSSTPEALPTVQNIIKSIDTRSGESMTSAVTALESSVKSAAVHSIHEAVEAARKLLLKLTSPSAVAASKGGLSQNKIMPPKVPTPSGLMETVGQRSIGGVANVEGGQKSSPPTAVVRRRLDMDSLGDKFNRSENVLVATRIEAASGSVAAVKRAPIPKAHNTMSTNLAQLGESTHDRSLPRVAKSKMLPHDKTLTELSKSTASTHTPLLRSASVASTHSPLPQNTVSALYDSLAELERGLHSVAEKIATLSPGSSDRGDVGARSARRRHPATPPADLTISERMNITIEALPDYADGVQRPADLQSNLDLSLMVDQAGSESLRAASARRPSRVLRGRGLAPTQLSPETPSTVVVDELLRIQTVRRGPWEPFGVYAVLGAGAKTLNICALEAPHRQVLSNEPVEAVVFHPLPTDGAAKPSGALRRYGLRVKGHLLPDVLILHSEADGFERALQAQGPLCPTYDYRR